MKKFKLFWLMILLSAQFMSAQFRVTKDGLETDTGEDFYVVSIDGKTANELFTSAKAFFSTQFRNPDAVLNSIENEMITIHGFFKDAFPCKKWFGIQHYADVDMNVSMYFKNNKIRIDIPSLNQMRCNSLGTSTENYRDVVFVSGGNIKMFNKDGKVKNEQAVNGLTAFVNNFINELIQYVKQGENNDW